MKGKTAGLRGVRWPDDKMTLGLNSPRYTAADMREAFVAGKVFFRERYHYGSYARWDDSRLHEDCINEALRRWPDKEEK